MGHRLGWRKQAESVSKMQTIRAGIHIGDPVDLHAGVARGGHVEIADIERLVDTKMDQLTLRPAHEMWAAHGSLCARAFVLAAAGWRRWADWKLKAIDGLEVVFRYYVDPEASPPDERIVASLEGFDIEDDGSLEWQSVVDSLSMLLHVLNREGPDVCLRNAMTTYLEGMFHSIADSQVQSLGRPISHDEAEKVVGEDPAWAEAERFVMAL